MDKHPVFSNLIMSKTKVIFLPDKLHETTALIKEELGKKFSCYSSGNLDEFDQVFQQSGKFVVLFSDPQGAVKFMNQNKQTMNSFIFKTFACLNKVGKFSPESQKILDLCKINCYQKSEATKLITDISNYLTGVEISESVDDIEFIMPGDE